MLPQQSNLNRNANKNRTLSRFDISLSYQISNVPGLLDAAAVDTLNSLTLTYLANILKIQEPQLHIFIDEAELLSQSVISRIGKYRRVLSGEFVSLWVTSAIRGFTLGIPPQKTTTLLVEGIDSYGYTNSIQNSGNPNLEAAFAQSAAEKAIDSTITEKEDKSEGNSASIALIAVAVIFVAVGLISACTYGYYKRFSNGSPCFKFCRQRKTVSDIESGARSPESVGAASHAESVFSFDDTATAGTNGLMRFISSFSRSRDSTSPNSSAQQTPSRDNDGTEDEGTEEELGIIPSLEEDEEEEEVSDSDEPHPLAQFIPPMVVYDCIEEHGGEHTRQQSNLYPRQRAPTLVPSVRVDASSNFIAVLGKRDRPSATNDLAEYLL